MRTRIHATVEFITPNNTGGVQRFNEPYDANITVAEYRNLFEQMTSEQNPNNGVSVVLLRVCNHDDEGQVVMDEDTQEQDCFILFQLQ